MKILKILFLGVVLLFSAQTAGLAQTSPKEQRKMERAEKKRLKEEARKNSLKQLVKLVKEKAFVLEANTLAGRFNQINVSPNTNFVKIAGDQIVVQTANNVGFGYNGLGGITIQGTIREYQIVENKNGVSVFIQFTDPVMGHSSLNLDVNIEGRARAMVLGNRGDRAIFQGDVVHLEESRIFKGRTII